MEERDFSQTELVKNDHQFASQFGAVESSKEEYDEYLKGIESEREKRVKERDGDKLKKRKRALTILSKTFTEKESSELLDILLE